MQPNDFIQVRRDAPLLESGVKAAGKVVERHGSIRMARGTLLQGHSLASDSFGLEELQAGPKPSMTACLWPGSAQALKTEYEQRITLPKTGITVEQKKTIRTQEHRGKI